MKLLKEIYKTYEGARKRAGFENGMAPFEFERGYKARLYRYVIVQQDDKWRVQRVTEGESYSSTVGGIPQSRG